MLTDKRSVTTVTNAVRRHSDKVQLNATWTRLNMDYGIGTRIGSALQLTEADHQTLRAMLQRAMAFDPLLHGASVLSGDRIELASRTRNEKVSRTKIADRIVMVASLSGELTLASGSFRHPIGGTLSVPAKEMHGLDRVLLIENLHVMFALHQYLWPDEVRHLPMLFRGSPQITPAAVKNALSGVSEVVCFPDYDPQGWMNTLTLKARTIVLPTSSTIARVVADRLDKPMDFAKQHEAQNWLRALQIEPVEAFLRREVAISQETMAGMALELFELPPLASRRRQ
ncbi:TPA: hypothetical protein ACGPO2_001601 [Pseudomonas aeruginosa]